MARARNIKPSFFQNDALGELPALARLLFVGMWTIADFKGCLEFRPKRIRAQVLPYDDCNIEQLTRNLEDSGFIASYSVQGQTYIKIRNFEKHQNPHKNEREGGSEIPDMPEETNEINELSQDGTAREENGTAPADSPFLIPDSPIPQTESSNTSDTSDDQPASPSGAAKPKRKHGNDEDFNVANWLFEKVKVVNATAKQPNWDTWADDIRLMREIDGRTHHDICQLFLWSLKDSFWCRNIQSPGKLREKWDRLVMDSKARPPTGKPGNSQAPRAGFENVDYTAGVSADGRF